MSTHELKTWPPLWELIATGEKTVEIRKDDRGYQVGDLLLLREYDPLGGLDPTSGITPDYTGRSCWRRVTHIMRNWPGLTGGYVAMSLARCSVNTNPHTAGPWHPARAQGGHQ